MKNKVITTVLFFVLAYFIPLIGNLSLLFTIQIWLLILLSIILLLTQPAFSVIETNNTKSSDKYSVIIILGTSLFLQVVTVIEWAYFRKQQHNFNFDTISVIGLLILIGGTVFRAWCIRTLGKYFTATVQTQANQKIIKTGAYSIIRHPSYLGFYLAIVGSAVFLHAYLGIIISAVGMFAAYYYRIKVEELTLVREFGEEYKTYQTKTKKLIPYLY